MKRLATLALTLVAAGALAQAPSAGTRKKVLVPGSGKIPLSSVVQAGDLVFVSGQLGFKDGKLVPGGIGPETLVTMENTAVNLAKVGLGMEDVVKCTVFLADIADFQAMSEAYARSFPKDPPARTTVAVSGLYGGARVEIECVAVTRG